MAQLKCKEETFIVVDYNDLDEFIRQETGHDDYESAADQEWNNDSYHKVYVDGELREYELKEWNAFKEDKEDYGNFMLNTIMNGLCHDGKLTAGKYLIHVCW